MQLVHLLKTTGSVEAFFPTLLDSPAANDPMLRTLLESARPHSIPIGSLVASVAVHLALSIPAWEGTPADTLYTSTCGGHTEDVEVVFPLKRDPYLLETSVPGVFVAGDVRARSIKRVASAVGEGSMAVSLIHEYLAQA